MTPDDMNFPTQPGETALDPSAAEGILRGDLPSGDAALDATLDALRALGQDPAPEPVGELATLLAPAVGGPGSGDQLGRRRQGHARHLATGTTAVAGILLVTATAAAALGTLHDERVPARPTTPPAGVVHPSTPRPAGTVPGPLPAVPVVSVDPARGGVGATGTGSGELASHAAPARSTAARGDDDDTGSARDDGREGDDEATSNPAATVPSTDDDDGATSRDDDPQEATGTSSGGGDGDDDAEATDDHSGDGPGGDSDDDHGSGGDEDDSPPSG